VRVEPKSNGIPDVKHNRYPTINTVNVCQTDLFIWIASCHKTESATGGTITPADLLPQYLGGKTDTTYKVISNAK